MKPPDWQKIKKVFNEAVELSSAERQDFLQWEFNGNEEMRREVEKMLVFADEESTTDTLEKNAFEIFANITHTKIPEQMGGYKIIREIGRGGMGAVYEAVRNTEAKFHLAEANRTESEIKLQFGKRREAIKHLETALGLFQKIWEADGKNLESRKAIFETHEKLAALYEAENQPQKALFHKREMEKITPTRNQNSPKS